MIRAVLFDFGGTLDGEGHWLDRFAALYAAAGIQLPRESIRAVFDEAEHRANCDQFIATADLAQMIDLHLQWQFLHLGLRDRNLRSGLVTSFVGAVYAAAPDNVRLLASLARQGLKLGVVSNGCGNTDVLCAELGYSPYLSVVVDSRQVDLRKPDPAIFAHATARLGVESAAVLAVGDSFERDVRPAKLGGLRAAWLCRDGPEHCPDPALVDFYLHRLSDLEGVLSITSPTFV